MTILTILTNLTDEREKMIKLTKDHILLWLEADEDEIHLEQFRKKHDIDSESAVLWQTFSRLVDEGKLKRLGRGWYRQIRLDYEIMNFKHKNPTGFFPIKYPFGLEEYVRTPRRSVVVIGGSPQAGKTAFAHNLIAMNWREHKVILWDSENSEAELEERLSKHADYMDWPDDLVRSQSGHYEDVIDPDALNIIDYLEAPENIWEIRTVLRHIRDKLNQGIVVVLLQKPEGRDLPYGKDWAKQLPRIVVSMEKGVLKILKGKSWVNKETNPDGLRFSFKIVDGEKFVNILPLGKEY